MSRFIRYIAVILVLLVVLLVCAGMANDNNPCYEKDSIYNISDSGCSNLVNMIEDIKSSIESKTYISFTDEERIMMYYIVEMEAHSLSHYHKQLISCVIVNRVYSDLFKESSIYEVLTAKNQFSSLFNYYNHKFEPESSTIQAVDSILYGSVQDPYAFSSGALFFYNPDIVGYKSFFENRPFLYEIEGHRFFA